MFWSKINQSTRKVVYIAAVMCLTAAFILFAGKYLPADANAASAAMGGTEGAGTTFPGMGVGPIPDLGSGCQPTQGTPLNVTFNVTGFSGPPTDVNLSITFGAPNHTWAGDVTATLIAPNGTSATVFGRVLATTATAAGDSSDLGGTYTFNDENAAPPSGGFWQAATAETTGAAPIANGGYRSTNSGGAGATNPMPATSLDSAFGAIPTANGTWTLRFTDGCAADTGAVTAASLTLEGGSPPVPAEANVDFNGDGTSDYVIARDITPAATESSAFFRAESVREKLRILHEIEQARESEVGPGPPPVGANIAWYIDHSGATPDRANGFGQPLTDFLVPNDYNMNGRDDIAVWRPGAPTVAAFYILNGGNFTVRIEAFGQTGDDPAITGDYDGDGIADLATYRCPALGAGDGQCFFFYKGSFNNPSGNITYVPWGFGETFDFFVNPGDFDGDGKYDFCIQRTDPAAAGSGQFVILKSSNLGVDYINWGRNTDIIVPGDYDGDGKSDFMVSRTETIASVPGRSYYLLTRTGGGTGPSPIRWGIAGDTRAPGDYDGDGKTDIAVWRPNADPNMNFFYVLRSSNGALQTSEWGQQNDFAVASWVVH